MLMINKALSLPGTMSLRDNGCSGSQTTSASKVWCRVMQDDGAVLVSDCCQQYYPVCEHMGRTTAGHSLTGRGGGTLLSLIYVGRMTAGHF